MDKLRTPASKFYDGNAVFLKLKHEDRAQGIDGQTVQMAACRAKQIKEAIRNSYKRRLYSEDYITRRDGKMFLNSFDQLGARWVKDADKVVNLRYNGWYTDTDGRETLTGVVLCFTRHGMPDSNGDNEKGKQIYMAGTYHSDWDGVTLDMDTTDCPVTAARWADKMAEREAESCREEDERYQNEQQAEELREQIVAARQACLKLLRDMRPIRKGMSAFPETVCAALRNQVEAYCESIAGMRQELKGLS